MDRRLNRNDSFIVCDAGGGTVDLISYQVEAALPRLEVKEIVPGTGEYTTYFMARHIKGCSRRYGRVIGTQ
jgi:hypothetical protein